MKPTLAAYLHCALWSSTDNTRDDGGDPLDAHYSIGDIAPESVKAAEETLADFEQTYGAIISESGQTPEQLGHDLWLTRNHHGAGFWDRGYPEAVGDTLTQAAHAYGESDAYVGDDGKIYLT